MNKVKRSIVGLLLTLALCVSSIVPAFAAETNNDVSATETITPRAGTETWNETGSDGKVYVCQGLRMYNNNLTPVKTLNINSSYNNHYLTIYCSATRADSTNIPIEVRLEIRNADTGAVIDRMTVPENAGEYGLMIDAYDGQRIQIFFDICSQYYNPNQNFRAAYITYAYSLF